MELLRAPFEERCDNIACQCLRAGGVIKAKRDTTSDTGRLRRRAARCAAPRPSRSSRGAFFVATADAFGLVSWAVDAVFGTALRLPALVARRVVGGDEPPAAARRCYTVGTVALAGLWFAIGASLDAMLDTQGYTKEEILAFMRAVDDDHDH
ncbi:hypothetical protein JL720_10619 [Aureococcus anophagefferens]|nr:hypothetical protein JL720_10619 [Aureococcus anophagefferens]